MTPDEREQINYLCKRIESEQDPIAFERLLRELNDLLETKQSRLRPEHRVAPNHRSTAK